MSESVPLREATFSDGFSRTYSRNVEALNERDPDLAADLLRYRPPDGVSLIPLPHGEWVLYDETARLYRSNPNHPTASARELARGIWPEIRGLPAIVMGRIGAGYELREILRMQESDGGRSPLVYVLVRDLLGIDAALRLHDMSDAIADGRLLILAGRRGLRRYAMRFSDGSLPLPGRRLRVFGERPGPWDRALVTVHRALQRRMAEHERRWAYAVACGYAGFDPHTLPALWKRRAARALVIAPRGRAAERAQAIAAGLEGAGVGTILLADGADPRGVTPCALALEIERFRPDLVVGIDRFRPSIIARADRLPYVAWCSAPASPDGFVFSSPTDFAAAETEEQAAEFVARGFLKENVLVLPPATDPRAVPPPKDGARPGRASNIAMIDDLDPPGPPATGATDAGPFHPAYGLAERVAAWMVGEMAGVRIDLWGENWSARPTFRRHLRGEIRSHADRGRIAGESGILVHPRPVIDGGLLDALAAGAFVMIHSPSGEDPIRQAFRDPEEVIFFGDGREFAARARHYLAHPQERRQVGDRARRKILEEWTFDLRCRDLMQAVTSRLRRERGRAPLEPESVTG